MNIQTRKGIFAAAAFVLSACMTFCTTAFADELEDAKHRKDELVGQRRAIAADHADLSGDLGILISDMEKLSDDIEDKKEDLKEQEERYVDAKIRENDQYIYMKKRIKFMYEDGQSQNMFAFFLESRNMSDLLSKMEYVAAISAYDKDMMDKYADVVKDSARREESIKKEYKELALLLNKMVIKKERLESLIKNRNEELSELDAQIGANASIIAGLIEKAEEGKEEIEEIGGTYESPEESGGSDGSAYFAHPCPGASISSYFGWRAFDNSFHKGVDFAAPMWTPTYAAEEGTVVIAGWSSSAGNWVVINHGSGLVTKYMHHVALCVSSGQYVERGQQIGYVGSTGYSTGPHLHFQVEIDSVAVDPLLYL